MSVPVGASIALNVSANDASIVMAAARVVSSDPTGKLSELKSRLMAGVAGSNVDASKILSFTATGYILDARRHAIYSAGGDVRRGMADFRSKQGLWFRGREQFERLLQMGRRVLYFSLNIGGAGLSGFGVYLLTIPDPAADGRAALMFPSDSLQTYMDAHGEVDESRVLGDIVSWNARDSLILVARGAELAMTPEPDWAAAICGSSNYSEIVIGPTVALAEVVEVRARKSYIDRMVSLQLRHLLGDALNPVERVEAQAFTALNGWVNTPLIEVE